MKDKEIISRNEAWKSRNKPAKIGTPDIPVTREHPEDAKIRIAAETRAAKKIYSFMVGRDMSKLIQTFSDADAQEMLESIREEFWGNL